MQDTLEDSIKYSIKVIHQSYSEYLSSIVEKMNEDFHLNSHFNSLQQQQQQHQSNYQFYQQNGLVPIGQAEHSSWNWGFEEIMKYFGFYARKFVRFSQNIPGNYFCFYHYIFLIFLFLVK